MVATCGLFLHNFEDICQMTFGGFSSKIHWTFSKIQLIFKNPGVLLHVKAIVLELEGSVLSDSSPGNISVGNSGRTVLVCPRSLS